LARILKVDDVDRRFNFIAAVEHDVDPVERDGQLEPPRLPKPIGQPLIAGLWREVDPVVPAEPSPRLLWQRESEPELAGIELGCRQPRLQALDDAHAKIAELALERLKVCRSEDLRHGYG
jgi:hypothetical protein